MHQQASNMVILRQQRTPCVPLACVCSQEAQVLLAAGPSNESKHPTVTVRGHEDEIHAAPLAGVSDVDAPDVIIVVQLMAITPANP